MKGPRANITFESNFLFYSALALAVAPIWLYEYLPAVDLPGHASQIAALREIWLGNPVFTDIFEINLRTPYLTSAIVAAGLAFVFPVAVVIKLLLTAVVVSTPLLYGALANATGGDYRWRWLVLPSTYSYAFYWGFLPFLVTVPLGLALLLMSVNFEKRPTLWRGLCIAGFSIFLLASHILALSFASLLSLMWIAGSNYRNPARAMKLFLPFMAPLPLIGLWLLSALGSGTYISDQRMIFDPVVTRLLHLIVQPSGSDGLYLTVSILISVTLLTMPLLSHARLTSSPAKWAMALAGLAVFMSFPSLAMGTAHVYQRFGVFLPVLWFLLWERSSTTTRRWDWVGLVAVFSWMVLISIQLSLFNIEASGFDKIVKTIGPGKRVAYLPAVNRSRYFVFPSYLHLGEWYQAKGGGIIDFNFAQFYITVVTYKTGQRPPFGDILGWRPDYFDWVRNGGDTYDYFIVHADRDVAEPLFKDHLSSVELVRREGWWWLYGRAVPRSEAVN